ncbi:hypothetical protein [Roseateles paludis]|jgi:hypothetical protein|uniref:Uncharacterized protein n=1 Tax=Roseateles paludis TaxID=3145238 RepID=A0ABV0FVW1_9BURK
MSLEAQATFGATTAAPAAEAFDSAGSANVWAGITVFSEQAAMTRQTRSGPESEGIGKLGANYVVARL